MAVDNKGGQKISSQITITVKNNAAPTITIMYPGNNSTIIGPAPLTVQFKALDTDGYIDSVEFFVNAIKAGACYNVPFSYLWMSVPGKDTLTAVATDNHGATTTSAKVVVTIKDTTGQGVGDLNSVLHLFNIYPNPVKESVTMEVIKSGRSNSCTYFLYDAEGKMIFRKEVGEVTEKQKVMIDMSSYAKGQYTVEILLDGLRSSQQIIKY
jgi:hypothetical protein